MELAPAVAVPDYSESSFGGTSSSSSAGRGLSSNFRIDDTQKIEHLSSIQESWVCFLLGVLHERLENLCSLSLQDAVYLGDAVGLQAFLALMPVIVFLQH